MLAVLRCPRCAGRARLRTEGDDLVCCSCGARYPKVAGVPVLLPVDRPVTVMDPGHVSHPLPPDSLALLRRSPGLTLNLGAGATAAPVEGCIEVEGAVFAHTTVVADAHRLPFADSVFDAVVTMNTFEHFADPETAAAELWRVLRPGGELHAQLAHLQPLHEDPHHYFNATSYGVRQWFRHFDIDRVFVPPNMDPNFALGWLADVLEYHVRHDLGPEAATLLRGTTLGQWQDMWNDRTLWDSPEWQVLARMTDLSRARFSAGFEIRATKPTAPRAADPPPVAADPAPAATDPAPAAGGRRRWRPGRTGGGGR